MFFIPMKFKLSTKQIEKELDLCHVQLLLHAMAIISPVSGVEQFKLLGVKGMSEKSWF